MNKFRGKHKRIKWNGKPIFYKKNLIENITNILCDYNLNGSI